MFVVRRGETSARSPGMSLFLQKAISCSGSGTTTHTCMAVIKRIQTSRLSTCPRFIQSGGSARRSTQNTKRRAEAWSQATQQ